MATPPDQLPLLVAALAIDRRRARAAGSSPTARDMRATQPGYRRLLGKVFHVLASIWVVGPSRTPSAGSRASPRAAAQDLFARQQVTSIVFDVELIYLARRRGYRLAVVPIRWYDRRGSRMRAGPGLALRVAWDLFRIPLIHRGVRRREAARPGRDGHRGGWPRLGRAALPDRRDPRLRRWRRCIVCAGRRHARLRLPAPTTRPRAGCSTAARCTTRPSTAGGLRPVLLPAAVRARWSCRSRCCPRRPRSGVWTALLIAAVRVGVAVLPGRRTVRWWIVLLAGLSWPFAYAIKLGQVGPILFLLFAIGWRWLDDPVRLGRERGARHRDQAAAGDPLRLGAPDPALGGDRRRASSSLRRGRRRRHAGPGRRRLVGLRDAARARSATRSRPPHNFTPGRGRVPGRASDGAGDRRSSSRRTVAGRSARSSLAARCATAEAVVPRRRSIASQLLSPVLWDHYAMLLLLPVAYLLGRPLVGAGDPAGHLDPPDRAARRNAVNLTAIPASCDNATRSRRR